MKGVDQFINGVKAVLFSDMGQMSISCCCGGAGVSEDYLDMAKAQSAFKQMSGKTVTKGVDMDFFFKPHWVTTAFMAAWVPPRSICVVALLIRSGEPTALGNNQQGLRCLRHNARNA